MGMQLFAQGCHLKLPNLAQAAAAEAVPDVWQVATELLHLLNGAAPEDRQRLSHALLLAVRVMQQQ